MNDTKFDQIKELLDKHEKLESDYRVLSYGKGDLGLVDNKCDNPGNNYVLLSNISKEFLKNKIKEELDNIKNKINSL